MTTQALRLLAAVDGSAASLQAGRLAIEMAGAVQGSLHLVSVVADGARLGKLASAATPHEPAPGRLIDALERAQAYLQRLGEARGVTVERTLVTETTRPPFEMILSLARSWRADLVFIGRTSRVGPGRALLGSQTEHVLELSPVPVVVVPEPASAGPVRRR